MNCHSLKSKLIKIMDDNYCNSKYNQSSLKDFRSSKSIAQQFSQPKSIFLMLFYKDLGLNQHQDSCNGLEQDTLWY